MLRYGFASIFIALIFFALLAAGAVVLWHFRDGGWVPQSSPADQGAATQTVVSSTSPTVDSTRFASVGVPTSTSDWTTFLDQAAGFEFRYPSKFFTEVAAVSSSQTFGSVVLTNVFQATSSEGDLTLSVKNTPFDPKSDLQAILSDGDGYSTTTVGNRIGYIYESGDIGIGATNILVPMRDEELDISFSWEGDPWAVGTTTKVIFADASFIEEILATFNFFSSNLQ